MKRNLVILGVAAIIAYLLVMLGSSNWLHRMTGWSFYKDWVISTASAFIVLVYFDRVHRWLDISYPWFESKKRLLLQILLLILGPLGMAVLITFLQYELLYDQGLITHAYFQNEFLVTLLIVGVINLCYFIIFLLRRNEYTYTDQDAESSDVDADLAREIVVIAQRGSQRVPVRESDIAVIWLESKVAFLRTFDGEQMILPHNLDKYEDELPDADFFRANRQMIVHRNSCSSFESIENGKIRIELPEAFEQSATVSQKKAARFREWIKNSP